MKENPRARAVDDEMAKADDLPELRSAFYVGKRKPLADLNWRSRWLIRLSYFRTEWASDYGIEAQAICTTRELAEEMCQRGGPIWFFHELPINSSLPDETVRYKLHTFPGSEISGEYEKARPEIVAASLDELQEAHRKLDHLVNTARAG